MLSQPRTARKIASNSWRRSESGTVRMRITMGLTLRRTARRINRLNGVRMLILSGYAAQPHSQTPGFLALSTAAAMYGSQHRAVNQPPGDAQWPQPTLHILPQLQRQPEAFEPFSERPPRFGSQQSGGPRQPAFTGVQTRVPARNR